MERAAEKDSYIRLLRSYVRALKRTFESIKAEARYSWASVLGRPVDASADAALERNPDVSVEPCPTVLAFLLDNI